MESVSQSQDSGCSLPDTASPPWPVGSTGSQSSSKCNPTAGIGAPTTDGPSLSSWRGVWPIGSGRRWGVTRRGTSSAVAALGVLLVLLLLFWGRHNLHAILAHLAAMKWWQSLLLLQAMFVFISFPLTFGYLLLNIACGYLYGFRDGVLASSFCAAVGILVSLAVCRHWLRDLLRDSLEQTHLQAMTRVLEGTHGFRLVALTRLTPIPFGLQNACFAVTTIPIWHCCLASVIGLLPAQVFHAHFGSTVRSMEELYHRQWDSYLLIVVQFLFLCVMLAYLSRLARQELKASRRGREHLTLAQSCLANIDTPSMTTTSPTSPSTATTGLVADSGSSIMEQAAGSARVSHHSRSSSYPSAIQFV